jgi:apolipoprotein N-acyltransferase
VGGLAFFIPALQWMRVADKQMVYTWIALAFYCSLHFPLSLFLIRWLDRRTPAPLVLSVPVAWTALEMTRGTLMGGFPWYYLAHTQHDFLPVIQISDVTGALGVTFLVAAVNAALFESLYWLTWFRRFIGPEEAPDRRSILGRIGQMAFAGMLVAGALSYGAFRLGQESFSQGPLVAVVQCNIEQGIRNATDLAGEEERKRAAETMSDQYKKLQILAARQKPDLIIWPETSHVEHWGEVDKDFPVFSRAGAIDYVAIGNAEFHADARSCGTNVLFGASAETLVNLKKLRRYNTAVLLNANGEFVDRYDKIHRVAFGEFMPLVETLPWLKAFSPYGDADYSITAGERFTRFPVGGHNFGVLICYEDSDPDLARQYAGGDGSPPADFLVNISNDGWFKGTSEHEEHLAVARFRAVECRRSMVRSVNMGISAVIDGDGRVLAPSSISQSDATYTWSIAGSTGNTADLAIQRWAEFKRVDGVLTASIPIDHRTSWYGRLGDWLPWSCWLGIIGGFVLGFARRGKR